MSIFRVLHRNEELLKANEFKFQEVSGHGFADFRIRSVGDNAALVAFVG
jgi:hypothetical protein